MADELPAELTRLTAMANILGELLFALIRSIVAGWAYALWVKLATWLEPKIQRRWVKIAVGGLLGLAAFFMIPIVMALLGL
ncbi:hypothetical protein ABIB75_001248 [Bradyrhizobium sp. GM2.2]|nr:MULTISPECIES: hypothetical protein [Bradyrhizobium]